MRSNQRIPLRELPLRLVGRRQHDTRPLDVFAAEAGLSVSHLDLLEQGIAEWRLSDVFRYAAALGYQLEWHILPLHAQEDAE